MIRRNPLILPFYIAQRYLFSKKSHNAINVISTVSVCGIVVVTIALVCALSVMNGFSGLISTLFSSFDPELKIVPKTGKVFDPTTSAFEKIKVLPDVFMASEVLQENVLIKYGERQVVATMKGVDEGFGELIDINNIIIDGGFRLREDVVNYATFGIGLASTLGINASFISPVNIYTPKREEKVNMANPASSFNVEYAYITSVFQVNQQVYDENYVIVPLTLARSLLDYDKEVSAMELRLLKEADIDKVKQQISVILGEDFFVQDRYEQQASSFKMLQIEKWMTFLILCFILLIALFNVVGSLSMLMIDKQEDVKTLRNMGADSNLINRIFLFEGWMISGFGALIGLLVGVVFCLLQQELGFIKLGSGSDAFVVDAYPVKVELIDVFIVLTTVLAVGFTAAWFSVNHLGKRWIK